MKSFRSIFTVFLSIVFLATCVFGLVACDDEELPWNYQPNADLDTSEDITLRIAISGATWAEMDSVIAKFETVYPNCTIVTEYIEGYSKNLASRLLQTEMKVDIFRSTNIQSSTAWKDSALNLISEESKKILDLSKCNSGLVDNFRYTAEENTQYAVPYGGEIRGMFANVTLLNQLGLSVPTNSAEFLNCCKVLAENDYIPLQGPTNALGQQLMYPSICNAIANSDNYQETWNSIQNIDEGISELFRTEYEFYYNVVKAGYCNFSDSDKVRSFLNIEKIATDTYRKIDDTGTIGFMVDTIGTSNRMETMKADYHSQIEYRFIASPVGSTGGYAYISPADGLAINKNSDHTQWALEFLNFFFSPEINNAFAEEAFIIPNVKDNKVALAKYGIEPSHTSDVGQVTFNYGSAPSFYNTVTYLLRDGYKDSYVSTNENYRSVYTTEEYYRKVTGEYIVADADYIAANQTATYYNVVNNTYVKVTLDYISTHADEIYYYKQADYYEVVDSAYIEANPTVKIYRHVDAIPGMGKMTDEAYMTKNHDGSFRITFDFEAYMDRLEEDFRKAKAMRDGVGN